MSFTSGAYVVCEGERIEGAGVIPSLSAESRAGFHTAVMSARKGCEPVSTQRRAVTLQDSAFRLCLETGERTTHSGSIDIEYLNAPTAAAIF
jgi:hypothetical protein